MIQDIIAFDKDLKGIAEKLEDAHAVKRSTRVNISVEDLFLDFVSFKRKSSKSKNFNKTVKASLEIIYYQQMST